MRKLAPIIMILFLFLVGGGFCDNVNAQRYSYPATLDQGQFGFDGIQADAHRFVSLIVQKNSGHINSVFSALVALRNIYWVENVTNNLPSVIKRNSIVLTDDFHAAATEEMFYTIDSQSLGTILSHSQTFEEFYQNVRINVMNFLVDNQYPSFNNEPYVDGNFALIEQSGEFKMLKDIEEEDGLDALLKEKLQPFKDDFDSLQQYENYLNFKNIGISTREYAQLGTLFLFKNEQELRGLGYELISWKSRINTDPEYRKYNIKTAFANIGHVRLIMPDEMFGLGGELHYSAANVGTKPFEFGYATIGGTVKKIYGGGLCGVATATFQGTLTNLGLVRDEYRAHTIYYRNLYEADINGITIKDPGLDATLISPYIDFKIKNIRNYPIVIVFNYDGGNGSVEQVFTLSKTQDRGSFAFVEAFKKGRMQCFTRNVNGKDITNCYNAVKNF